MMQETIISFETAVLAKEKGFHSLVEYEGHFYDKEGNVIHWNHSARLIEKIFCLAPTQSLLAKWLREVHKTHVSAFPISSNKWFYTIRKFKSAPDFNFEDIVKSPYSPGFAKETYEEALEAGLKQALTLINVCYE